MSDGAPADLRNAYEAATKQIQKLEKENQLLVTTNRSLQAANAFRAANLSPDLADLFVAASPDAEITAESAKEFAAKYGISAASEKTAEPNEDGTADTNVPVNNPGSTDGLDKIARAGSGAGEGGAASASTQTLTRQEFVRLQTSDPVSAQKALAEGRVRLREDNPYATTGGSTGGNPFTPQAQGADSE